MVRRLSILVMLLLLSGWIAAPVWAEDRTTLTYAAWVKELKAARKGPFKRIRWYCADGTILAPEPYACSSHGGGIQHGEWNDHTRRLRQAGYLIGNVLGEYATGHHEGEAVDLDLLKSILLERFLVARDNGWIFRRARFYRGAIQREDEARGESALLRRLAVQLNPATQDYLLLWESTRLLPGSGGESLTARMRNLATQINEKDHGFNLLRNKLHAVPEIEDAAQVRDYAANRGDPALQEQYEALAKTIEALFDPGTLVEQLRRAARKLHSSKLRKAIRTTAALNESSNNPSDRLAANAGLLQSIRKHLRDESSAAHRETLLRIGQRIEKAVFADGMTLRHRLSGATRAECLEWLQEMARALNGIGLLSNREWAAVAQRIAQSQQHDIDLSTWRQELQYLARIPQWSAQWLKFHFSAAVNHLAAIEPLARQFIPARLRGSPLSFYSEVIDLLLRDADRLGGVSSELFGQSYSAGLRALNPGLARGRLLEPQAGKALSPDGIYLLRETTADITPVAGIVTLDEGNALSHVQLLAANLGIPNIVVSRRLLPELKSHLGEPVVIAASPGGVVQIAADDSHWDDIFLHDKVPETPLHPDTTKLDLKRTELIPLRRMRATDSGVVAGPKAANLGELKHFFPQAVTQGLVVPFGRFRAFLDHPMDDTGMSVIAWMRAYFRYIESLTGAKKKQATTEFLTQLHRWIEHADPGKEFRNDLINALRKQFGEEGSYALFVRSDTNMEDLPGFTGAGLNLTVPNVVGTENIVRAIMRVWASPFTERAFAWRQQRMANPENVYPSVLLLKTVPVEKSGVILTFDTTTGGKAWFSVATSLGIGGAVQGEAAEELLVNKHSGETRLLKSATSPVKRIIGPGGGLIEVPVTASDRVLSDAEIGRLRKLVARAEQVLPQFDEQGTRVPADIEFGFTGGKLALFQIRPYLRSKKVLRNRYLMELDQAHVRNRNLRVDLNQPGLLP